MAKESLKRVSPIGSWSPDFVVAGAPKCGTSSIYEALEKHPEIRMSPIKEPHFFATDFPGFRQIKDHRTYRRLFRKNGASEINGEASTLYLASREALPAMLERRPAMKIIAVVRNPIELYQSLHNEKLKELSEDERDPEIAWGLQSRRATGRDIPSTCKEPGVLQYRCLCLLGEQVQRLMKLVPARQRLVLVFDDLKKDPAGCLGRIADFLGVSRQPEMELPWTNSFAYPRSLLVAGMLQSIHSNSVVSRFEVLAKPGLNRMGIRPVEWVLRMNLRKMEKPRLRPEFRAALKAELADDVALLGNLLNRDLNHWLEEPAAVQTTYRLIPGHITAKSLRVGHADASQEQG